MIQMIMFTILRNIDTITANVIGLGEVAEPDA